ncbi:hypothetical protein J056_003035 [Wallemia ichthyophaga EXF-994]|uniref:Borealin N-terminal domain-containing protein n=1 Tax=Wallemia ichthyophaga (strain EXF-994 / CBS 113033) TaxID=1299270 RepID=R9AN31_WALI9|nr:uncharacterized protein J056_003035 [Wallemia ichthyophaga EXF-994]EOR03578.1 hypothetical protein J056_003035 [Wallemia ichthyophaga EXF-994]TIB30548.1 hypothetical protein E3P84_03294 [Wallemia ichthyophaga]TIB39852.1 hypothetical protein E3P83_03247 [Wallemia ichthyophaga]
MMRNAVAVTATPDKSKSNWTAQAQAFSEDESDAILQSYLLDVDNKRKAMKLHLDRSLSAFTARSLSILASVPKALHNLTLGEFQDKFGGDLVRAVRGEGVKDATHDLEDNDREEEWEAARKRKRVDKDGDGIDPSQSPQLEKKTSRKNTKKVAKTPSARSTRSTRSKTKGRNGVSAVKDSEDEDSHMPSSSFNPTLTTHDDLPDEAEVEAEVRAGMYNTSTHHTIKRRPSIQLVGNGISDLNIDHIDLPNASTKNETRYLHDTATLFIPLPDGTKLAVDPARAEPEELNKLEGVNDEMRDIVRKQIERRMQELVGLIDRWKT